MLIYNATTKHLYSPANYQVLAQAAAEQGWPTGEFAGFHQWRACGRVVRKGETSVPVVLFVDKKLAKNDGQEETAKVSQDPLCLQHRADRTGDKPITQRSFRRMIAGRSISKRSVSAMPMALPHANAPRQEAKGFAFGP